jgi:multidrug efflux pump subunit AcrA (membrane-fusion protein)
MSSENLHMRYLRAVAAETKANLPPVEFVERPILPPNPVGLKQLARDYGRDYVARDTIPAMRYDLRSAWKACRPKGAEILETLKRLETKMSDLTNAVAALTTAKADQETELGLVLAAFAAFPAKITAAVAEAVAAGADPATLTAITSVTAELAADHQKMVDALAAPPPVS